MSLHAAVTCVMHMSLLFPLAPACRFVGGGAIVPRGDGMNNLDANLGRR